MPQLQGNRPLKPCGLWVATVLIGMLAWTPIVWANDFSWGNVAADVVTTLETAVTEYRGGNEKEAKRALTEAYFGVFESRKLEAAMRKTMGQTHTFQVERKFGKLRRLIGKKPVADLEAAVAELAVQLRTDAAILDEKGIPEEVYDAR